MRLHRLHDKKRFQAPNLKEPRKLLRKFKVPELKNDSIAEAYKVKVKKRKGPGRHLVWSRTRYQNNSGFDDECQEALEKKNESYSETQKRESYDEQLKILRQKKREHFEEELQEIDNNIAGKNARQTYKIVESLTGGYQFKTTLCRSKNRAIIGRKIETRETWASYLKKTP